VSPDKTKRVALITGGNRGIGFETARQLAARGLTVILAARDLASGQNAAAKLTDTGGDARFLSLDASDTESIRNAAAEFAALADRLDVLVNNAGIYPDEGVNVLTIPRAQMIATFQTNTFGPLEITQAFLPFLRESTAPRIINVSSGYGEIGGLTANVPSYCLSKLALNGLTIMLSEALRSDRIAVNSMCPGWVRTDMGGPNATRSIEEGADTAVWLADEAPHELTGKFFRDRNEISW
jgi:NAD(P)-dependent dehydrogenase (short-subunit alcohol dehydrogenase family)